MSSKTAAVVFEAPSAVVVREVSIPDPGPGDVVVDTITSWISPGTELSTLRGDRIHGDTAAGPDTPFSFPRIGGYQKIGKVVSFGAEVQGLRVGQVVFATIGKVEGMFDAWGGHLARNICPAEQVFALPAGVDPESFSGAVLMQVGFNAGSRPPVRKGDLAVVLGDGLVGLWTAQTLQYRGARVWLVGRHQDRLRRFVPREGDRAIQVGRDETFEDLSRRFTEPIAILVETICSLRVFEALVPRMRRDGHLVCTGFYGRKDALRFPAVRAKELTIHTPAGWTRERLEETIALLGKGALHAASLITHRLPVREAAKAYQMLSNHEDNALGVLLQWPNA
jgi:3-hydroxyethyl bacteriochlorophyllide a dehydrogenase